MKYGKLSYIVYILVIVFIFCGCGKNSEEINEEKSEQTKLEFIKECMQNNAYDTALSNAAFVLDIEETDKTNDEQIITSLYYYVNMCANIEETVLAIDEKQVIDIEKWLSNFEHDMEEVENNIQFLPEEYKKIYQEIKDEYTILQIIQWEKEYEEILRIEIMESIRNELEEITQNEREYTIANERNFLIEKRNLLKSISQEWVTKEGMLSELGEYYLDFISNELEGASESISVFASWFTDSKKYLEENFDDYTEDNWYFDSANTQESALTYGEIHACITLYESYESIDESVAESSKEIDNAISTRNDRNSFKKGYLSGKSEQTLIEEFIVEIGTIMNGKE